MPRLTTAEKLRHLDAKEALLKELLPFEKHRKTELEAVQYEKYWLQNYKTMNKRDQDNYSRNKGFDLSVQSEIAAKYGLGPSDASAKLKTVYNDFVKIKEVTAARKTVVTYGVQLDSMGNVEQKDRTFDYCYEEKAYELQAPSNVSSVSGAIVSPPFINFVRGTDQESSSTPSSHSPSRSQIDDQIQKEDSYIAPKRMKVEKLLTTKVYREYDPPTKLCAAVAAVSRSKYYMKIECSLRPPHYVIQCMCGKRAPLEGIGTLFGEVDAVEVVGKTLNQHYIKMDLSFVNSNVYNKLHNEETIDDLFLKHCITTKLQQWERRKNRPLNLKE